MWAPNTDQSTVEGDTMNRPSRRKFLGLAGASAASAAAAIAVGTGALGRDDTDESAVVIDDDAPTSFVVQVTDVRRGDMRVLAGATEVDVRDRTMAANLARMRPA
jgi:hypothetical protein